GGGVPEGREASLLPLTTLLKSRGGRPRLSADQSCSGFFTFCSPLFCSPLFESPEEPDLTSFFSASIRLWRYSRSSSRETLPSLSLSISGCCLRSCSMRF